MSLVSPSGDSIVGSLIKGETDPTVSQFNEARQNFLNFFKQFGDWRILLVVVVVAILILVAIIKL